MTEQSQPDSEFDYNFWLKELSERGMLRSRDAAAKAVSKRVQAHDAKVLPAIREYRRQGLGFLRCAQMMNLGDLPTPRGSGGWTAMMIARICRRHGIERK